jgi:hypothetical protein
VEELKLNSCRAKECVSTTIELVLVLHTATRLCSGATRIPGLPPEQGAFVSNNLSWRAFTVRLLLHADHAAPVPSDAPPRFAEHRLDYGCAAPVVELGCDPNSSSLRCNIASLVNALG